MNTVRNQPRSPYRRASIGCIAGAVLGVAATVFIVIATLGVSMAGNRSWGIGFVAKAVVTGSSYSMTTGPGVLVVPFVAAVLGAGLGLLTARHH